jgi:hypothetical protein
LTLTSIQADYNSRVHGGGLLKKATWHVRRWGWYCWHKDLALVHADLS